MVKRRNAISVSKGKKPNLKKIENIIEEKAKVTEDINEITTKKVGGVLTHSEYPAIGAYIVFN